MKKYAKLLVPLSMIAVVYLIFHLVGIGCPIKFATGISCPGCGMSRACMWLLSGDLSSAFYFHPLFWVVPLFPVLFILKEAGKIPKKVYDVCVWIICILFLAVWIIRMLAGNGDVVVFAPEKNIFSKAFQFIKNGFQRI